MPMPVPLSQHQEEIQANQRAWAQKPLLQAIYADLYARIIKQIDASLPGQIVEIGSGMGNLKTHLPAALCTDLFPNPWLDAVCDGYGLPFKSESLSHLVLSDVFHHLEAPNAFLREAQRVLIPPGRIVIMEPYISACSYPVYGLLHHEPVAMDKPVKQEPLLPRPHAYYAAQGNATRLFFKQEWPDWPRGWRVTHREAFSAFAFLLSGGFSKPALYPASCLGGMQKLDAKFSRWPKLFGGRCIVVLEKM